MAKSTSLKLKDGFDERLKALSATRQRSPHWLMNDAIGRYLADEERRVALLAELRAAKEEYERGGRLHLTQEEVEEWMEQRKTDRTAAMPKLHP